MPARSLFGRETKFELIRLPSKPYSATESLPEAGLTVTKICARTAFVPTRTNPAASNKPLESLTYVNKFIDPPYSSLPEAQRLSRNVSVTPDHRETQPRGVKKI